MDYLTSDLFLIVGFALLRLVAWFFGWSLLPGRAGLSCRIGHGDDFGFHFQIRANALQAVHDDFFTSP